ncbi:MAG: GTP 3',8-cyclase MoaA [Ignavibacteriae bacterium]|nr:GTP 3',8-cyclase MoaA [Ignavibacteriota bacterium]
MKRLVDRFGRVHEYLRISVTDRCNLRCRYCLPLQGVVLKDRKDVLSFDEIETLARIFVDLGIRKIRITGGEPLVRKGVEELCLRLAAMPELETLALTTNGVFLEEKAALLKNAGVQNLNISLDTLRPERFRQITYRNEFDAVLRGIEAALGVGFPSIKINTVVMKGFNDDELLDFVELAKALSLSVRFIEYMPFRGNGWSEVRFLPYHAMKEVIESQYTLIPVQRNGTIHGPAKEFYVKESNAVIGFITTMSEHFCSTCNRLRLTAVGKLRSCLFAREEFDLKRLLRARASRDVIEDMIRMAVILKWEKHPDAEELVRSGNCVMTTVGG